jgi:carboxyl-terminal processing protease
MLTKDREFRWSFLFAALFVFWMWMPNALDSTQRSFPPSAHAGFFDEDLEVFEEVVDLISDNYVYPPDYKKLFTAAIEEMLNSVGVGEMEVHSFYSGQTLQKGSTKVSYRLSFSRGENMRAMRSVYDFMIQQFPKKLTKHDLEIAAITGMMNSLDSYSLFLNKEDFERSMRDTEGQYGGVGMVITMEDYKLTVVRTLKNSPAERAGILPKDVITRVDSQEIKGMQIHELANKLRGYPNTEVGVDVFRPSTKSTQSHNLTREIISIETVTYKNLGQGAAYLKINSFSKQTNDQMEKALEQAERDKVKGFVLDLRDNPGGLLSQSVKVASHFLNKGQLIVYTRGRDKNDTQNYQAQYSDNLSHMPLVVLINPHSASASEIVAGSLKDSGKALILGENSYGKGSVQTIFRMGDGSGLRLTTSKYYTPSGIDITAHGITPEVSIEKDITGIDDHTKPAKAHSISRAKQLSGVIKLKESELKKFLKKQKVKSSSEDDPLAAFAQLIIKNSTQPSRSNALAKAKELVQEMHY